MHDRDGEVAAGPSPSAHSFCRAHLPRDAITCRSSRDRGTPVLRPIPLLIGFVVRHNFSRFRSSVAGGLSGSTRAGVVRLVPNRACRGARAADAGRTREDVIRGQSAQSASVRNAVDLLRSQRHTQRLCCVYGRWSNGKEAGRSLDQQPGTLAYFDVCWDWRREWDSNPR